METKSVTLCQSCNNANECGDLTGLDFHHDQEVADQAAEVIGSIPFAAESSMGDQWDHTCDACGSCDRFADLMGGGTTIYTWEI